MTSEILQKRETIEREQFIELLEGKSEDEVFQDEPSSGRKSRRQTARRRRGASLEAGHPEPERTPA